MLDLNGRHAEFSGQHRESFDHLQLSGQGDDESGRVGVVQHRHRHYTVQPGIPGRIPGGGWRHVERCQVDRHREESPDRRCRRIRPNGPLSGPSAVAEVTANMEPTIDSEVIASVRFASTAPRGFSTSS